MKKLKVFISSVQTEFARERENLFDYLHSDPLLGLFFQPFLFENLPASDQRADSVYLNEVGQCDIYLGLFGAKYGFEDAEGISPTEREFDEATRLHKTRLIYVLGDSGMQRHAKMNQLIQKVGIDLVRKRFNSGDDLNSGVYASLVNYLKEKEIIRTGPFDASLNEIATLEDLDQDKIKEFVHVARAKRGFPLPVESSPETILTHLNLLENQRVSNAAILLFGKLPQRFFITSEVKCAHFHGFDVVKPIPAYQVYKGDVFQLVNQAVDFVLSKVNVSVGTREESNQVPIQYELPRAAVSEAIVNAIAHRDYTNNGSVQVMLFKDRLEIWNPGILPLGLSPAKLRKPHRSIPANPLLAEPMYLAGYIERMGTGTGDIIRLCNEVGLKEPEFIQEEDFKTIIWRTLKTTGQADDIDFEEVNEGASLQATPQATLQATLQADEGISETVKRVVLVLEGDLKRAEIQELLELRDRTNFVSNYLNPSLESGYIEMTIPEIPTHQEQRYRLTDKGIALKKKLQKSKKKK
jgi:predicted HTH transcriptional regulator